MFCSTVVAVRSLRKVAVLLQELLLLAGRRGHPREARGSRTAARGGRERRQARLRPSTSRGSCRSQRPREHPAPPRRSSMTRPTSAAARRGGVGHLGVQGRCHLPLHPGFLPARRPDGEDRQEDAGHDDRGDENDSQRPGSHGLHDSPHTNRKRRRCRRYLSQA